MEVREWRDVELECSGMVGGHRGVCVGGWRVFGGVCGWSVQGCGGLWMVGAGLWVVLGVLWEVGAVLWVVVGGWRCVVSGCGWLLMVGGGACGVVGGWGGVARCCGRLWVVESVLWVVVGAWRCVVRGCGWLPLCFAWLWLVCAVLGMLVIPYLVLRVWISVGLICERRRHGRFQLMLMNLSRSSIAKVG